MLNIFVDDKALDLYPDEIFTITLQATDIVNLTGSKADFTKTIQVPATTNNQDILGVLQDPAYRPESVRTLISCRVVQDGTEILGGYSNIIIEKATDTDISITIYAGNITLASALADQTLADLDWTDLNFDYTVSNAAAIANNNTGVSWAIYNFEDKFFNSLLANGHDIRKGWPVMPLTTIFQKISDQTIIEIVGLDELTTPPLADLAISFERMLTTEDFQVSRGPALSLSAPVNFTGTLNAFLDQPARIPFDVIIEDPAGEWNATQRAIVPVGTYLYETNIRIVGTTDASNAAILIYTYTGASWIEISNEGLISESFEISFNRDYAAVDNFAMWIAVNKGNQGTVTIQEASWELNVRPEALSYQDLGTPIDVGRSLGDVLLIDVVRWVRTIYGCITLTDNYSRQSQLIQLDKMASKSHKDWSSKLDTSRAFEYSYRRPVFAQKNNFQYTEDEEEITVVSSGQILVDDKILDAEKDLITLFSSPSEDKLYLGYPAGTIRNFQLDFILESDQATIGTSAPNAATGGYDTTISNLKDTEQLRIFDEVEAAGRVGTIVRVSSDTAVIVHSFIPFTSGQNIFTEFYRDSYIERNSRVFQISNQTTAPILYHNGYTSISVPQARVCNFKTVTTPIPVDLSWSKFLDDNWKLINKQLLDDRIIEAYFNLTPADVAGFDFSIPVYVEEFGARFYVNEIQKYRADQSTKVILIRI
jgi:hypothetical protein